MPQCCLCEAEVVLVRKCIKCPDRVIQRPFATHDMAHRINAQAVSFKWNKNIKTTFNRSTEAPETAAPTAVTIMIRGTLPIIIIINKIDGLYESNIYIRDLAAQVNRYSDNNIR